VGFAGKPYAKAARAFWLNKLKPIIKEALDAKDGKTGRAEGALELKKRRLVFFLDTKSGLLAHRGIALRSRSLFENGALSDVPEVTLKFRTPDLMRAAEYCEAAGRFEGNTVLEEDIAPFQVARGKEPAAVAKPRSTFTRFSVSTKRDIDDALDTLGAVFARFGAVADLLGDGGKSAEAKLRAGPTIYEWVFQDASADLGDNLDAEFGFTLWHFPGANTKRVPFGQKGADAPEPRVAEISFDFKTKGGRMDADAAKRAQALFIAMQKKLRVNRRETSKTALGLPSRK
jgi:hypothetical protein